MHVLTAEERLFVAGGSSGDVGFSDLEACGWAGAFAAYEGFLNPIADAAAFRYCVPPIIEENAALQDVNGVAFIVDEQGVPHPLEGPSPESVAIAAIGDGIAYVAGAVWDGAVATFNFVVDMGSIAIGAIVEFGGYLGGMISNGIGAVGDFFGGIGSSIGGWFGNFFGWLTGTSWD